MGRPPGSSEARSTSPGGSIDVAPSPNNGKINIAICGLSAAGKTTHAKLLERELGYRYVSGTGALARMLNIPIMQDPPAWMDIAEAVARVRRDDTDLNLEEHLVELESTRTGQIFDVWALPWTSQNKRLVRIWLESTAISRALKCYVSQGSSPSRSVRECLSYIENKDAENRGLFERTQGFDLFKDRDVFQIILDNSGFITHPTETAANAGIDAFAPFVRTAIDVVLGNSTLAELAELEQSCAFPGPVVRRIHTLN
jgi:cytidylate kinase